MLNWVGLEMPWGTRPRSQQVMRKRIWPLPWKVPHVRLPQDQRLIRVAHHDYAGPFFDLREELVLQSTSALTDSRSDLLPSMIRSLESRVVSMRWWGVAH